MSEHSTKPICSFPECKCKHRTKGLCNAHYLQKKAGKTLFAVNSTQRVRGTRPRISCDESECPRPELGSCHVFRGCLSSDGYGSVGLNGKSVSVHRYIWECENGDIPDGLEIDHQCMNKSCCNIDHLRLVTHRINSKENTRRVKKSHCKHGHPFNEQNTFVYKDGPRKGRRWCKACGRISARRTKHK